MFVDSVPGFFVSLDRGYKSFPESLLAIQLAGLRYIQPDLTEPCLERLPQDLERSRPRNRARLLH